MDKKVEEVHHPFDLSQDLMPKSPSEFAFPILNGKIDDKNGLGVDTPPQRTMGRRIEFPLRTTTEKTLNLGYQKSVKAVNTWISREGYGVQPYELTPNKPNPDSVEKEQNSVREGRTILIMPDPDPNRNIERKIIQVPAPPRREDEDVRNSIKTPAPPRKEQDDADSGNFIKTPAPPRAAEGGEGDSRNFVKTPAPPRLGEDDGDGRNNIQSPPPPSGGESSDDGRNSIKTPAPPRIGDDNVVDEQNFVKTPAPPYMDFVGGKFETKGKKDASPKLLSTGGLRPNFTLREYEEYCRVEEMEQLKARCDWKIGSNRTMAEMEENRVDEPLNLNNLFEQSKPPTAEKIIASEMHHIIRQNRQLMMDTIMAAIYPTVENETEPASGFKLLNTTRRIFGKLCPPNVVSPKFLNAVYTGFKKLHDLVSPDRTPFLTDFEFELIDEILEQCLADAKPANYIQNDCKEDVVAVDSLAKVLCLGYTVTDGVNRSTICFQTNIQVYDPLVDVTWIMFEAVKASCFNHFQGNIRLLHRYSVAMNDLFTRGLKTRWPLQREEPEFWERVMGPGLDLALSNIDKCVHHIVKTSTFDFRTPRFFHINSVRLSHTHINYLTKR